VSAVAHTEEEKFWGCIFRWESLVKSRLPRRAEGALLALEMMVSCVSKMVIFRGKRVEFHENDQNVDISRFCEEMTPKNQ